MFSTWIFSALFVSLFAVASPIGQSQRSQANVRVGYHLDELEYAFRGIYWREAFRPDICDDRQPLMIINAFYGAQKMMENAVNPSTVLTRSYAWSRYFGFRNYWLQSDQYTQNQFEVLQSPGSRLNLGRASSNIDHKYTIIFCPYFFDGPLRYLEDRSQKQKPSSEIAFLDTYERAVAHELMHVDDFGYEEHIGDQVETFNGDGQWRHIYGESNCREYAHMKSPKANLGVVLNACEADNYSWFFLYYYYEILWHWRSLSQSNMLEPGILNRTGDNEKENLAATNLPKNAGHNEELSEKCHRMDKEDEFGNSTFACEYTSLNFTERVFTADTPLLSEGGCDLSHECHTSLDQLVHPNCTCKCNRGRPTSLSDERCKGYAGDLPVWSEAADS
ncbi:hypothetical protein BU24DRAFT_406692 [Aaosphaeria arxii CBS 175.79]|uniref:Lysine-specific metallo-endopeptidase domain-containing protein n=1 Tax=Aaosphaeria arxii CBS 175.79 TaxID=1450172 RepID=A0A6A5Y5P4_9PLEO|nr:uncharacterized protein BU24DRAFT_406692 [Aaosphaeria arxii CBS 175.79]KAF2020100.1 hypothetical protein BU24DRAFT_406692 [Aaosphaeria arxii CBS 175.79]